VPGKKSAWAGDICVQEIFGNTDPSRGNPSKHKHTFGDSGHCHSVIRLKNSIKAAVIWYLYDGRTHLPPINIGFGL